MEANSASFDSFYVDVFSCELRAPEVSEFYRQLENLPSGLEAAKGQIRLHISAGLASVAEPADWHAAAGHYKKCITVVEDVRQFLPEELQVWLSTWARFTLVPIYHLELKFFKPCIDTLDMILLDLTSEKVVVVSGKLGQLAWYRRAVFYEWGHKLLEDGEQVEGQKLIERALEASEFINTDSEVLDTESEVKHTICEIIYSLHESRGRYAEARRWNNEAVEIEVEGLDEIRTGDDARVSEASLFLSEGNYQGCIDRLQEVKEDLESACDDDDLRTKEKLMFVYFLLGVAYDRLKDEDASLGAFQEEVQLLKQLEEVTRDNSEYVVKLKIRRGVRLNDELKFHDALACFEEVYERISKDKFLQSQFGFTCLDFLATCHQNLYLDDNDVTHLKLKERYFKEALALPLRTVTKAYVYVKLGETLAALDSTLSVISLQSGTPLEALIDGSKRNLELGNDCFRRAAVLYSRMLFDLKEHNESWVNIMEERGHKMVFWNLQIGLFYKFDFEGLIDEVEGVARLKERSISSDKVRAARELMKQALVWAERGRTRTLMYQLDPRCVSQQATDHLLEFDLRDEVAWDSIRKSLSVCGPGTVFVEYSYNTLRGTILVYVVTQDGEVDMRYLQGGQRNLEFLLENIHKVMSDENVYGKKKEELMMDLEYLYVLLIEPIADLLAEMKPEHKLIFAANEILNTVPFPILRDSRSSRGYLIEHHTVAITPSLRVLKHCNERLSTLKRFPLIRGTPGAGVVIGDPAYLHHRIKGTGVEADKISDLFGSDAVVNIQGTGATVEAVLDWAELPSQRSCCQGFLHFAVHGHGDGDSRFEKGALELADPRVTSWPPISVSQPTNSDSMEDDHMDSLEEDLVHSTQLMEMAEQSSGDVGGLLNRRRRGKISSRAGILRSEDIIKSGFEWRSHMVVLSACDTSRGKVFAEGVLNLPRAFMLVGVPCTVVSQWRTVDDFSPEFMNAFYLRLRKGSDVASALRSSMLEMLDKDLEVYNWGAFVVCGLPTVQLPNDLQVMQDEMDEQ